MGCFFLSFLGLSWTYVYTYLKRLYLNSAKEIGTIYGHVSCTGLEHASVVKSGLALCRTQVLERSLCATAPIVVISLRGYTTTTQVCVFVHRPMKQ